MTIEVGPLLLPRSASIRNAMATIDLHNEIGIALIVEDGGRLVATVTDGDIRRAILAGLDLDGSIEELLRRQRSEPGPHPVTAAAGTLPSDILHLMNRHDIRHVPIVDGDNRPIDIALLRELAEEAEPALRAVVMAGGFGTRLRELTQTTPKPMLPIGERPLLERIVDQLRSAGVRRVNLATHYRSEQIAAHFGDGSSFGVEIGYVTEEQPLGTAGALGLLDASDEPLLVINGDVLTDVDFRALLTFHRETEADMTVAVRPCELRMPFGVVETSASFVTGITEKPSLRLFVNAGIYLLEPGVQLLVPEGERCDMPELIQRVLDEGRRVASFPLHEYWLDIGRVEDYERAQRDANGGV